jgi:outer membrane protein assembly factor BamA
LAAVRAVADYTTAGSAFSRDRTPIRASWETIGARTYGYSISREDGIAVGATAELVRRHLGSFADATTTTGDARAYLPGLAPHHVVAVRIAGGASIGDVTVGRTFLLGGESPGGDVVDFGSGAFTLLRGFSPNTFAGSHVAVANAEYRWPIARPQRGHGTWPLFLHTVHAAVFADAGQAWTRTFQPSAIKSSAGAELSANLVAGFFAPFTATFGAAWGHDGSVARADRVTAYFRIGRAF